MHARTVYKYPFKLRIFDDGRIKSRSMEYLSRSEYAKYINISKSCFDCQTLLVEYQKYKFRCPNCGETFSWGFNTLSRDYNFYINHPEYSGPSAGFQKPTKKEGSSRIRITNKILDKKSEISDTYLKTWDLVQKRLPIDEIAVIRGLKRGTIVEHLSKLIDLEFPVDISVYVPEETQNAIINAYNQLKPQKLKEMKEFLGNDFSYDDIRLVTTALRKNH